MGLSLPSATLIGYSSQGNFFGEDTARWRTVQTVTVEGIMDPTKIDGAGSMIVDGSDLPTSANSFLGHSVAVNGVGVNNSRLTSIEFPASDSSIAEMHDNMAKYVATYEVYIVDGTSFFGISFNDLKSLEEFSEDISFELSEENAYSVTWSMNVRYASGTGGGANSTATTSESADGIAAAKALWTAVTASTPASIPTSMQGNGINIWTRTDSGANALGWVESEVYDTQGFSCNFSRSRSLLSNNDSNDYTSQIKNSLTFNEDGTISVTEEGEVRGLKISGSKAGTFSVPYEAARNGASTLINGSYTRCNTLYGAYKSALGTESLSLLNQYVDKSVSYDPHSSSVTYSVNYTNSPTFDTTNKIIFESTLSKEVEIIDGNPSHKYTEEGVIKGFGSENDVPAGSGSTTMADILVSKMSSSITRVSASFGGVGVTAALIPMSTKHSYKPINELGSQTYGFGSDLTLDSGTTKEIRFSKTFSDAPQVRVNSVIASSLGVIKQIKSSVSTKAGVTKKEWYNPPNNPIGVEFYSVGPEIVGPSIRKVSYSGTIRRNRVVSDAHDVGPSPITYIETVRDTIQNMVSLFMKVDALNVYTEYFFPIDKIYVNKYYYESFEWSFNSRYEFTATLSMKYIAPIGPHPMYPVLHSDNTQLTI